KIELRLALPRVAVERLEPLFGDAEPEAERPCRPERIAEREAGPPAVALRLGVGRGLDLRALAPARNVEAQRRLAAVDRIHGPERFDDPGVCRHDRLAFDTAIRNEAAGELIAGVLEFTPPIDLQARARGHAALPREPNVRPVRLLVAVLELGRAHVEIEIAARELTRVGEVVAHDVVA